MNTDDARYHVWLALGVLRVTDPDTLAPNCEQLLKKIDTVQAEKAEARREAAQCQSK